MVEYRVGGADFSNLPYLALGEILSLTPDSMADLRRQGIDVDDDNDPAPDNIPYEVSQPSNS